MPRKAPLLKPRLKAVDDAVPTSGKKMAKSVEPSSVRPDRAGTRLLGAHISEAAYWQFRELAVREKLNANEMLKRVINEAFERRGLKEIA
jgi:hypothetical protein